MICAGCGYECGALEYDIEVGACLCPKCRADLGAEINPRRCPFCKSRDLEIILTSETNSTYSVFCHICGACGPIEETPSEALNEWNKAPRVRE